MQVRLPVGVERERHTCLTGLASKKGCDDGYGQVRGRPVEYKVVDLARVLQMPLT